MSMGTCFRAAGDVRYRLSRVALSTGLPNGLLSQRYPCNVFWIAVPLYLLRAGQRSVALTRSLDNNLVASMHLVTQSQKESEQ